MAVWKPESTVFNCVTVGIPSTTPDNVAKRMAGELTEPWMNKWRKRIWKSEKKREGRVTEKNFRM